MTQKLNCAAGFALTGTSGEQGELPESSEDGMDTSETAQEIVFLQDPKTSEAVAGGVEAPVGSVGSVQTKAVQQRCLWGGQVNKLLPSASAEIRLI